MDNEITVLNDGEQWCSSFNNEYYLVSDKVLEDFEKLESPYLIALMYPIKENLMSKINNIVTATSSFLYTPWQI